MSDLANGAACRRAAAPRRVQLALQPLDFSTQSLPLAPQPLVLVPQALALCALSPFAPLVDVARLWAKVTLQIPLRHAAVMADWRKKYKYKIVDLAS